VTPALAVRTSRWSTSPSREGPAAGLPRSRATAVAANDALIRHQIFTRSPDGPHSTGPLEQFFHHLDSTIGDRAAHLTNKARTDALLSLIASQRNGWADETAWTELIRNYLHARRGHAHAHRPGRYPEPTNTSPTTQNHRFLTIAKRAASTLSLDPPSILV